MSGGAASFAGESDAGAPVKPMLTDLKSLERAHILETLAATGVRKAAAERLGMSERTLRYKLAAIPTEEAQGKPGRQRLAAPTTRLAQELAAQTGVKVRS